MECDFKKELEDKLEKLIFLYDYCYFNNAETQGKIWEYEEYDYSKYEYQDFE